MEVYAEDFDVDSLIDQVAGTTQPLMGKSNNRFRIERGERLGSARQDLTKLRQSLLNMLSKRALIPVVFPLPEERLLYVPFPVLCLS